MTSKIDFESTILALFDKLSLLIGFFKRFFLGAMLILGQKAFKDPLSLKFRDRTDIIIQGNDIFVGQILFWT